MREAAAPALKCLLPLLLVFVFSFAPLRPTPEVSAAEHLSLFSPDVSVTNGEVNSSSGVANNSEDTPVEPRSDPWYSRAVKGLKEVSQWGGHYKLRGAVSWPEKDSLLHLGDASPAYDGYTEGRLNSKFFLGNWGSFVCQYQMVLFGGDSRRKEQELIQLFPGAIPSGLTTFVPLTDDTSLLDLSSTIYEDDSLVLFHRLDRLYLALQPDWGFVRIGRQAVTWGNGLLFNPMDLANPFRPTNIDRDYKVGDDMVWSEISLERIQGDFQLIYVPRRDADTGQMEWWDESALAGKFHWSHRDIGFDIMGAANYGEAVVGLGSTGYLGGAGWRVNTTWTFLNQDNMSTKDGYLSLVANLDYYWVWWNKNFAGFVEYYFNGLGVTDYRDALTNPDLIKALERGSIFTLGRNYLSGSIRVEVVPLVNVSLSLINNIEDPSGIFQGWVVWNITQALEATLGGNVYYGGENTEFGGIPLSGTGLKSSPPTSAFLWLTWFF